MKYDIFKNKKEKNDARKALPELVQHPGWKFITKTLDANIEFITDELKTKKNFESLEEVFYLQDRLDDLMQMKDLPATIVEAAQDDPPEDDDSIYE